MDSKTAAVVVVPMLDARHTDKANDSSDRTVVPRSAATRLAEAQGLAEAIDLEVVEAVSFNIAKPRPATLLGQGAVEKIGELVEQSQAELVILDHSLSPVQQRNLERELKAKVIDRTGLILEIFGRRAKTREGVLQVELAHLTYQKGRLVRSWTHLERQRGGGGFMGGPGETQIEADRRLLQGKIDRIKLELEQVTQTRKLHRAKRQRTPHPVVALVGYTNAGKSTLFNKLTGAGVLAADMLFATLDPTLRRIGLPHGGIVILSDTVGFISNLPTHLVAAFRATLEEVVEADLILHVRDIADPESQAQAQDVESILHSLGVDPKDKVRLVEVWNKIDLLDNEAVAALKGLTGDGASTGPLKLAVSAITGEGLPELINAIENKVAGSICELDFVMLPDQFGLIDWIYRNAKVLDRKDRNDGSVEFAVSLPVSKRGELEGRLGISQPEAGY